MATLLQAFQTRTWCSNNLCQTPLTESAAYASDADTRTGWAGLNQTGTDGLPNGRYVLELRCEMPDGSEYTLGPARART